MATADRCAWLTRSVAQVRLGHNDLVASGLQLGLDQQRHREHVLHLRLVFVAGDVQAAGRIDRLDGRGVARIEHDHRAAGGQRAGGDWRPDRERLIGRTSRAG
ncbi:hypothetical protein [Fodinicola feengrottensis]|uniref:hypothetical protein n=1 Tax=Fodinicola feengrottensis TaxID=435914 RepID=UPI0024415477|nr:hypothetical protein [Fodinicola feengrottensis]